MTRASAGSIEPSTHGNAVVQAPLVETKVRPAGVGSVTVTLSATDGPSLVMVSV